MRNQFTQMVKDGIAPFNYTPITGETPTLCPICRTYNAYWGAATDTHMSITPDGVYVITGHMLADGNKWQALLLDMHWGGINWEQTGFPNLLTFLQNWSFEPQFINLNGDLAIQLRKKQPKPATNIKVKEAHTSDSRMPINIRLIENVPNALSNIFESAGSLDGVVKMMNETPMINGNKWVCFNETIVGTYGGRQYVLEMSLEDGQKIETPEELQKLLDSEKLGDLYLVQYKNYFKIASDDKKWSDVLNRSKYNSIQCKNFEDFTAPEWMDQIKNVLVTIN